MDKILVSWIGGNDLAANLKEDVQSGLRGPVLSTLVTPDKFFHDRYFISNTGAIRSGQGFSEDIKKGAHSDTYKFNIIGKEEANGAILHLNTILTKGSASIIFQI